jgi:hypothetical protein
MRAGDKVFTRGNGVLAWDLQTLKVVYSPPSQPAWTSGGKAGRSLPEQGPATPATMG